MIEREIDLLSRMIAIPSVSWQEDAVADLILSEMEDRGFAPQRMYNNVYAIQDGYDESRPTLMLNSHMDTVRPVDSWTRNPFSPEVSDGRLYGLGSNDAGASVVSLIGLFGDLRNRHLAFNLLLAITAEEEVMGERGMRAFLPYMEEKGIRIDMAIVGEPTGMQPAVGERGLLVLDCVSHGVSGHAARNEGDNALYNAIVDIERLRSFKFPRQSSLLGPVNINVTQISAGTQHNVVPDRCCWVADVRTTDAYSNEETVEILRSVVDADVTPRSTRVWASAIETAHPLVRAAVACGGIPFVSPTTSDMALMHGIPSLKIGPGVSSRSHTADEYILTSELIEAQAVYNNLIDNLSNILK